MAKRRTFPLLPLRDITVFPHMVSQLFVGRERSINARNGALNRDKEIVLAAQTNAQDLARAHALELELGAHEGHGTDFPGDVDGVVGADGHAPTIHRPSAGVGCSRMPVR